MGRKHPTVSLPAATVELPATSNEDRTNVITEETPIVIEFSQSQPVELPDTARLLPSVMFPSTSTITMKDAQQKWKSLRDYYRKEIRKMQEERSGSSADTIYKSNWPYFMLLDFLRSQFKTRPTSGNLKEKIKPNKCLDSAATEGVPMASDENFDFENSQIEESYASNQPPNDTEATEMRTDRDMNDDLVHPNTFKKSAIKKDSLTKLVQIEEKKLAILEEKRGSRHTIIEKPDEDLQFFESLLPHIKHINGVDKLRFRNEVQNLVIKYAYPTNTNQHSVSSESTNLHSRSSTSRSVYHSETSTPLPQQDGGSNSILDLDSWNSANSYSPY
ncbi:hypothetical protein J6590_021026 [Homalodisca vitripennis]|nr:hypothetical protein J6590_021026 [Homalodisca vitripennis]